MAAFLFGHLLSSFWVPWTALGVLWEGFGTALGAHGRSWAALRVLLESFGAPLGYFWKFLGCDWVLFKARYGSLGVLSVLLWPSSAAELIWAYTASVFGLVQPV